MALDPSRGLEQVVAAWRLSPDLHQLGEPADDAALAAAERRLGRPIPDRLKALYRISNGMAPLDGNLMVDPLDDDVGGMIGAADRLRGWNWPIPDELLMIGGNGGDELFGVWYPPDADPAGALPVVMVGSVFEPACLALAGTDLPAFLRAWSGYYLVLLVAPRVALDALGLPDNLRTIDDEAGFAPYFHWADAALPDPDPDPYERAVDAAGIAELLRKAN